MSKAIGGYFELELPASGPFIYPMALGFQSARAAFLALLHAGKPKRVWMPRYICDCMLSPLESAGVECVFYSINEQFDIDGDLDVLESDWLFYVNYFGVCNGNVDRILSKFNSNQVVLDHSQAFFSPPRESLATIYSPRKFFGVPDGGLLVTNYPISMPTEIDDGSLCRSTHLLKRLAESPEYGYADYITAEQSLYEFEPLQMSHLTRRILESVDFEDARIKRNNNFRLCHAALGHINHLSIDLTDVDGALCYPFFSDDLGFREKLISESVFVPTYWPDALKRVADSSCEASFVKNIIPLPCDQRYLGEDMERIFEIVKGRQ